MSSWDRRRADRVDSGVLTLIVARETDRHAGHATAPGVSADPIVTRGETTVAPRRGAVFRIVDRKILMGLLDRRALISSSSTPSRSTLTRMAS